MASDISADLRRVVMERANHCCEYCRLPQAFTTQKHEPDLGINEEQRVLERRRLMAAGTL